MSQINTDRRFPWMVYAIVWGGLVLLTVLPMLLTFLSIAIAQANGCPLDEGGAHACMIGGADWGEALGTMFVMGWLMYLTMPFGAVAFCVWLLALIIHRLAWRRKQRIVPS